MMDQLENVITLVKDNDPGKLVFDQSSIEKFKNGETTVLSLASHPGKVLGYFPCTKLQAHGNTCLSLGLIEKEQDDCFDTEGVLLWRWTDSAWIKTIVPDNEFEFVIRSDFIRQLEERVLIWLTYEIGQGTGVEDLRNGCAFLINDDGSISPKDDITLYLGRRGGEVKEELLHEAVRFRDVTSVQYLLENSSVDSDIINTEDMDGRTPLAWASFCANVDMIHFLLKRKADIDKGIFPPILAPCVNGDDNMLKFLLRQGARVNIKDRKGNGPLFIAARSGSWECLLTLLNHSSTVNSKDAILAINVAIKTNNIYCLGVLLRHKALFHLDLNVDGMCKKGCQKGIVNGLPIVKILLETRGDLQIENVKQLRGAKGKKAMAVLISAYAKLSARDLTLCVVRAYRTYCCHQNHRKSLSIRLRTFHNLSLKDDDIAESESADGRAVNPLLRCMQLAEVARRNWKHVRQMNTAKADEYHKLYSRLQLSAAAILEEIYQDDVETRLFGEEMQVINQKELKLEKFLESESSHQGLQIAHRIHARAFFSQPIAYNAMNWIWYGSLMHGIFVKPSPNIWYTFGQIIGLMFLLLIQLPLLPFLGYLPKHIVQYGFLNEYKIQWRFFHLDSRNFFIITEPVVRFVFQCTTDFVLAILFTLINPDEVICSMSLGDNLLLFAVASVLSIEIREMIRNGLDMYFLDPFHRLDFPALLMGTLSLLFSLTCRTDGIHSVIRGMLSVASILFWLRMLRFLTLFPEIGPLTLMVYKMIYKMMIWATLLVCFILAFASGMAKLKLNDACSDISVFAPLSFFEVAITGEDTLFECRGQEHAEKEEWGFANIIIYTFFFFAHIMLINMLIAVMGEAFSSVWEAQEASYLYQRTIHCLGMREMKFLPLQCLYLPYGICEVIVTLVKKAGFMKQREGTDTTANNEDVQDWVDDPCNTSSSIKSTGKFKYEYDEKEEKKLFERFDLYISEHQDEASEEDRWRLILAKKMTKVNRSVQNMEDRIDVLEQRMDSIEGKIDDMTVSMKSIARTLQTQEPQSLEEEEDNDVVLNLSSSSPSTGIEILEYLGALEY